ncbi:helix-turn-helix domain-containing protein [Mucilaginibacter mali]|uniref:Helix-turn-helix domain-containing protein n=1 Tax=Mucilaginibacter mali TaxID=2740462 RepID=A0A7D4UEC6_9SPHI|nr:helix-turn-helix transcriptional regulator [Mucilaginibacter mali]QKJ31519.1 helix-turn-helix domain-containing protein [Mucilaginibacter mali]
MKAQLLKVFNGLSHSFTIREDIGMQANKNWHYHPEIEIIQIKQGEGTHFIGDSIRRFKAGDIFLIGSNLPHFFRFDDVYFQNESQQANVYVAQFSENFWGDRFLLLPENTVLRTLLDKAKRGIALADDIKEPISNLLNKLLHTEGPERIIMLLEILTTASATREMHQLSSIGFKNEYAGQENDRINVVYDYSFTNFKRKIELEEIAAIAGISPNSFCRYFKARTKKTYSQFIIEIKVGYACKLLIDNKYSVKQICYESGFNNFASFHKYFKLITNKSPLDYKKEFITA